jgi:hypothetical protein
VRAVAQVGGTRLDAGGVFNLPGLRVRRNTELLGLRRRWK